MLVPQFTAPLAPSSSQLSAGFAAKSLTLAEHHTCALVTEGGIMCWGRNDYGQLGIYSVANEDSPRRVALSAGASHGAERPVLSYPTTSSGMPCFRSGPGFLLSFVCWYGKFVLGQLELCSISAQAPHI